jgi:F0F1-type ATP synthase beta subunit
MNEGKVSQVIGAVVDVEFEAQLPKIRDAIKIDVQRSVKGIPEIRYIEVLLISVKTR